MTSRVNAFLVAGLLALPRPATAARPKPEALRAFQDYARKTEERIQIELQPGKTFLWVDGLPATRGQKAIEQLRRGTPVVERMQAVFADRAISAAGAMIHHWIGTILIPGVTLQQVLRTIQDYDRHQNYFYPEVVRSRTIRHDGDDFTVYLRLKQKKVVTVVFDTEHQVRYHHVDAAHAYSESRSTRIAEIENASEAGERALPAGDDHGFLWRLNSYWRFAETQDGVYVQCEALSLTRDIPTGLGWLAGAFVESVPQESLTFTLQSMRAAVYRAPY